MSFVRSNDSIETQKRYQSKLADRNYEEATTEISLETEKDENDTDNVYKENLSQDRSEPVVENVIIHQPTSNNFNCSEQVNNNFNAEALTIDLEANLSMVTDGDKEYISSSVEELDQNQSKKNKFLIQYCPTGNTIRDGTSGPDNQQNRNVLRLCKKDIQLNVNVVINGTMEHYNKIVEVAFPEEEKLEVFKNEVLPNNNFMEEDIENKFDILQLEFPERFRNIQTDRKKLDMELLFIAQRNIVKKILNDQSLFKGY